MAAMLPKLRIVSVLVLGLGVALTVIGLLLPRLIHADGRLPLDIGEATWTLRDDDALVVSPVDPEQPYVGPATRQLHLKVQDPASDETVTVRIGSTLTRDAAPAHAPAASPAVSAAPDASVAPDAPHLVPAAPEPAGLNPEPAPPVDVSSSLAPAPAYSADEGLVRASVWDFVMDRLTGEPVGEISVSDTVVLPPAATTVDGVWLKFPAHTSPETHQVIDETLREALPADFVGVEKIDGSEVFHFRQEVPATNVATRYPALFGTLDVPAEEGRTERLYLYHSATKDLFVEPVSGLVVRADVAIDDFYGLPDGTRVRDALTFSGGMTEQQTEELLGMAGDIGSATAARGWSVALIVLGVVMILCGAAGAMGVMRRRSRADALRS